MREPLMEPLVTSGDIAIRLMRDDDEDYVLMSRWLSDERVLEFYGGRDNPHDLTKVRLEYGPNVRGQGNVVPCMLVYRGVLIGYLQHYTVEGPEAEELEIESTSGVYGVDLFIGDPELWDKGIGTAALSAFLRYMFDDKGARRIIIDPRVSNLRAIRCYEKCGFHTIGLLEGRELHEGEYWDRRLMAVSREDFDGAS